MSQIDRLNFFPHLFWFIVLLVGFYFIVFSYMLPYIYQTLEVRSIFFKALLTDVLSFNIFYHFFIYFYNTQFFEQTVKTFLNYLRAHKSISAINSSFVNEAFFTL